MLLIVVVVGTYLYLRLDDEVRRYAETMLADHYDQLDVKLGSAHFEAGRGIVLRDLVIRERHVIGDQPPLAEVPEMMLLGSFDAEALASCKPRIERVRMRLPRIQAVRSKNGQWNLSKLFPPPSMGGKPADVELVSAILTLTDNCNGQCQPMKLREVNLSATCTKFSPDDPKQRVFSVTGSVGGELAQSFTFSATADTGRGVYDGEAEISGLDIGSSVFISLRNRLSQCGRVTDAEGRANLNLAGHIEPGQAPTWNINYEIADARVSYEGLSQPITSASAVGTASQDHLKVDHATAMFGKAHLAMAIYRRGWKSNAPLAVRGRALNFRIDDSLEKLLPEQALEGWHRFEPRGLVTAEVAAQFDGCKWIPSLTVDCHDVSFIDNEKFAYRLSGGTGRLRVSDPGDSTGPVLEIQNLKAMLDLTPLTINGRFGDLTTACQVNAAPGEQRKPTGWLEIKGDRVPITDRLVNALAVDNRNLRKVVDSLGAKGHLGFRWKYLRDQPIGGFHTETDLKFQNCRVRFNEFPYPLENVTGTAQERDGNWQFNNLVSNQADSPVKISASGTCSKLADGKHDLLLTFVGEQVPLDEKLRRALPSEHQVAWRAVNPLAGRIAFVARVAHRLGQNSKPNIYLEFSPIAQSVSIEPEQFPYKLERLQGKFVVLNNQVTFTNLRGSHGQTVFETNGYWLPNGRGGWLLEFQQLNADRLAADYDLKLAAPSIGKIVEYLKPTGTFSIHNGSIRFSRDSADSTNLRSDWKVALGLQQNNIEMGVPLRSVTGIVRLAGQHEGNLRFTAGQLELDSLFWNGMQFTNVRGPLWVDPYECRLGREATNRMNKINRRQDPVQQIEADMYGGRLALDAKVALQTASRYVMNFEIDSCDLKRMSTEYFGGAVDLSGALSGNATIQGMGKSLELLQGGGKLTVRDAQLYELPVMTRMLKVLRNRVPDKTAFTGVDAQFTLDGQTVRFSELNLLGDAVSLYGQGTTTFDRDLNLRFYSTVGRNDFNIPLLRSMIGQASANLLLIKVTGPAENAQVERAPLPAVNELMEQLGGDNVATPRPRQGFWKR